MQKKKGLKEYKRRQRNKQGSNYIRKDIDPTRNFQVKAVLFATNPCPSWITYEPRKVKTLIYTLNFIV